MGKKTERIAELEAQLADIEARHSAKLFAETDELNSELSELSRKLGAYEITNESLSRKLAAEIGARAEESKAAAAELGEMQEELEAARTERDAAITARQFLETEIGTTLAPVLQRRGIDVAGEKTAHDYIRAATAALEVVREAPESILRKENDRLRARLKQLGDES